MRIIQGPYQVILACPVLDIVNHLSNLEVALLHLADIGHTNLKTAVLVGLPVVQTLQQRQIGNSERAVILQETRIVNTRNRQTAYANLRLHEIDIGPGTHIQSKHIGYGT